ncbi:MAG: pectinesterase family protein, partial [Dehalococcoidales bacterium]|nr:pectinesterase family protein [Dehalococcoidales bacterium]
MKRKFFSIFLTLVLVLSFGLIPVSPVSADSAILEVNGPVAQMTSDGGHYMGSFSPDGSRIVYTGTGGIWTINADGSDPELIYPSGTRPKWGPPIDDYPDGLIALAGQGITIIQPDGTLVKTIDTTHAYPPTGEDITGTHSLDWSFDGSTLAFADNAGTMGIWTIGFDGENLIQITDYSKTAYAPAWSPDGTEIACAWGPSSNMYVGVFAADGTGLNREIGIGGSSGGDYPDWGTNGKIAYHDGTGALRVMNDDGSNDAVVSAGPVAMVAWSFDAKKLAYINGFADKNVITRGYPYASVQDAIDAADPGDVIKVAAGRYDERIVVGKPLTLRGATWDINKNGYEVPAGYAWDESVESILNNPEPAPTGVVSVVLIQDTNDVNFEGFIVQSLNAPPGSQNDMLLTIKAQTMTLNNINIKNSVIGPNTNLTDQDGTAGRMGLYISLNQYQEVPFGLTNSSITGTKIFGAEGNGNNVFIWGSYYSYGARYPSPMDGTVFEDFESYGSHRSGFETGGGITGLTLRNGKVYNNGGYYGSFYPEDADNLKYGNGLLFVRGSSDSGEQIGLGPENMTVDNLEVYGNQKNGAYHGPVNKGIDYINCDFHDNGWDDIQVDLEAHFKNPTFEDEDRVGFFGASEDFNVHSTSFSGSGGHAVQVIGTPTNGFVIDATKNWWGTAVEAEIQALLNGAVAYDPWYASGDMSQLVSSKPVINTSQETYHNTIQEAIDAANPGDTIQVTAGTYDETIVVNDALDNLLLQGAGPEDTIVTGGLKLDTTGGDLTGLSVSQMAIKGNAGTYGPGVTVGHTGSGFVYDLSFDYVLLDGQGTVGMAAYINPLAGNFSFTNGEITG